MTARILLSSLVVGAALTAAACAASPTPSSGYNQEMERLTADCAERGGILSPAGATTGRPATDYFCEIRGGGGRLRN